MNDTIVAGVISVVLALAAVFLHLSLEQWSYLAQIITSLSVVFAVATYYFQKERARLESIGKQIHLFRMEVIELAREANVLITEVHQKSGKELVALEQIEEFSIKSLLSTQTLKVLQQQAFWNEAQKLKGETYNAPIEKLLNALEELAISILAENVSASPHLKSIRKAFVVYVESYAWLMVLSAPYSPEMYPAVRTLYSRWRNQIDRLPVEVLKERVKDDIQASATRIRSTMSKQEYDKLMGYEELGGK